MAGEEENWSVTAFFVADLHGWVYRPRGYSAPGMVSIANSIAYRLELLREGVVAREGLSSDHHRTALLLGGDTFAYESPACSIPRGPQLIVDCVQQVGMLVDDVWALVGNHDLHLFQFGDLPISAHAHPDWLFASDLLCTTNASAFARPGVGDVGPCTVVAGSGGAGATWTCSYGGSIRRHAPVSLGRPYILALHLGMDQVETAHAQAQADGSPWLCTLAGHNHYEPLGDYGGHVDIDAVVETPPYGTRMVELWIDMRDGRLTRQAFWRSPEHAPETPHAVALAASLDAACAAAAWLDQVVILSTPMVWDGRDPSRNGTLGAHVILSQYQAAAHAVPECSAAYLPPSAVRTGKPRGNETGLRDDVTLTDAWSVFPYPTDLVVAYLDAAGWWKWIGAQPDEDRLLYVQPGTAPDTDGEVAVATSSWALDRKIPPVLVKDRKRVGDGEKKTRDFWIDYLRSL